MNGHKHAKFWRANRFKFNARAVSRERSEVMTIDLTNAIIYVQFFFFTLLGNTRSSRQPSLHVC